jgi:hypothetical protein
MTDQELLSLCADVSEAQAAYNSAIELHSEARKAADVARERETQSLGTLAGLRRKLDIALGYKA